MSFEFRPIRDDRPLSEKIMSRISDAIINGELRPDDRLPPERELAEQFQVSRTVIRDAVKTLAGRGILRVKRGAGIFVATNEENVIDRLGTLSDVLPTQETGLHDLFEMRRVLEAQGAEWAAHRRSARHLERLRNILEDASRHPEDPHVLSERDAQFHVTIAEASQNPVLVRVMLTLLDLLETGRRKALSIPGRAQLSLEEHERILEEIEARNPDEARRAMLNHLTSVESAIVLFNNKLFNGEQETRYRKDAAR
jgi:GntR family transcriptional regulator, transcriptional repressor for pyruvate dehydrogenase complex